MTANEEHLIARIWCPHGHSFYIIDRCPQTRQDEDAKLPKLTRKEKRALKKGKL